MSRPKLRPRIALLSSLWSTAVFFGKIWCGCFYQVRFIYRCIFFTVSCHFFRIRTLVNLIIASKSCADTLWCNNCWLNFLACHSQQATWRSESRVQTYVWKLSDALDSTSFCGEIKKNRPCASYFVAFPSDVFSDAMHHPGVNSELYFFCFDRTRDIWRVQCSRAGQSGLRHW